MGPGWAYVSGQVLDVNIISQYGIGFVVVIGRIAQFLGGFSYEHVMAIMVMGSISSLSSLVFSYASMAWISAIGFSGDCSLGIKMGRCFTPVASHLYSPMVQCHTHPFYL